MDETIKLLSRMSVEGDIKISRLDDGGYYLCFFSEKVPRLWWYALGDTLESATRTLFMRGQTMRHFDGGATMLEPTRRHHV